jgi:hypothetical protein
MERVILCGPGTFLVIAGLGLLIPLSIREFTLKRLLLMPIGVAVLQEARRRVWLLGFLLIPMPLSIAVFFILNRFDRIFK